MVFNDAALEPVLVEICQILHLVRFIEFAACRRVNNATGNPLQLSTSGMFVTYIATHTRDTSTLCSPQEFVTGFRMQRSSRKGTGFIDRVKEKSCSEI